MKRTWSEPELEEFWTLTPEESVLVTDKPPTRRLGLAMQLKFLQIDGQFPRGRHDVPAAAVRHLADQLDVHSKHVASYDMEGRSAQRDRVAIRQFLNYREANDSDNRRLVMWLCDDILPRAPDTQYLDDLAIGWLKEQRVEAPAVAYRQRLIRSAISRFEDQLHETIVSRLTDVSKILSVNNVDR